MSSSHVAGRSADIDAARLLLARIGVTAEQLTIADTKPLAVPSFDDYIERVSTAVPSGTRRVYEPYWKRIRVAWGGRSLDEPTPLEIGELAERAKAEAVQRRNSRGGRSAAEHMISAFRCIYKYAVADRLLDEADNPALRVPKPRRLASTRRALLEHQLAEINEVAATTGNDPDLDLLILRLHTETACRRAGALALRPNDLDAAQCLVLLREKGETVRWQPVSPTLMQHLQLHANERAHHDATSTLLRYRNGRPLTQRRYDHLWHRLGKHVPWIATQQVSTHWLRHTTLTWVERNYGYAVARAYAGHTGRSDAGTTATYVRATLYEVALALSALAGEAHPLAQQPSRLGVSA